MTDQRDTDQIREVGWIWKIDLTRLLAHINLCPMENAHSFQTQVEQFQKLTVPWAAEAVVRTVVKLISHSVFLSHCPLLPQI